MCRLKKNTWQLKCNSVTSSILISFEARIGTFFLFHAGHRSRRFLLRLSRRRGKSQLFNKCQSERRPSPPLHLQLLLPDELIHHLQLLPRCLPRRGWGSPTRRMPKTSLKEETSASPQSKINLLSYFPQKKFQGYYSIIWGESGSLGTCPVTQSPVFNAVVFDILYYP